MLDHVPLEWECRHLNGIPTDNRVENLAWGTHEENMQDRVRHGTMNYGEKCYRVNENLSDEIVVQIIRMWESGSYSTKELAEIFKIGYQAMWAILRGRTWKHLPRNRPIAKGQYRKSGKYTKIKTENCPRL